MNEGMAEVGDEELVRRASGGDSASLAMLFGRHRDRLEKMVRARLDRSLQGRFDPADVLQETFIDVGQQLGNYPGPEAMPVFLWLRLLTCQRLSRVKRMHQGAARRSAGREISVGGEVGGEADSASIADFLVGRLTTAHDGEPCGGSRRAGMDRARGDRGAGSDRPQDHLAAEFRGVDQRRGGGRAEAVEGGREQPICSRHGAASGGVSEHSGIDRRRRRVSRRPCSSGCSTRPHS
jgi:hypothetical protein